MSPPLTKSQAKDVPFGWRERWLAAPEVGANAWRALKLVAQAGSWKSFWTLFGTSNQLLAALSLMGVSVWLKRSGKRYWYTAAPMVFVSVVTLTSLVLQVRDAFFGEKVATVAQQVNGAVAVLLFVLAASLLTTGAKALLASEPPTQTSPA